MTPETRAEMARLLLLQSDIIGQMATLLASDPTEQPEPPPPPHADTDPDLCEHPEDQWEHFPGGQLMCMSCGASHNLDDTWTVW